MLLSFYWTKVIKKGIHRPVILYLGTLMVTTIIIRFRCFLIPYLLLNEENIFSFNYIVVAKGIIGQNQNHHILDEI